MEENSKRSMLLLAGGALALAGGRAAWRRWKAYDFRDKTVLITGGSRGLGLLLARDFAGRGARLAICARNAADLERARKDLAERGAAVLALTCDVTRRDEVEHMVALVRDHYGRIDVLVNNAGIIQVGPMEEMTMDDYDLAMRVHFWGPLYAINAVLPEMRRRRDGRIVNITSIGGKLSVPHLLPYNASKFAAVGLSEGLRAELAKDSIRVTTVAPGLMRTGSPRQAIMKGQHRLEYLWFSVSDSLPLVSMSAERAARKIVAACAHGDPEVILSVPAKLAARFHGLFPGLTARCLGLVNRLLPSPGGIGRQPARGWESFSALSPSMLTALGEHAAARNNEIAGDS